MNGEGNDGSSSCSSGEVSTTAADEGPNADPDEPNASPPTMNLSPENFIALYQIYDRIMQPHHTAQQPDPNSGAAADFFFFFAAAVEPRDRADDRDDADDEYGSFFLVGAVPASGEAMASLPATTVGKDGGGGRGECAVCLEAYVAGEAVRTMPCAHGFHERCIFQWLRASRLCPLCRFAMPPEPEEEEDTDDEDDDDEREAGHHDDGNGGDGALDRLSTAM